MVVWSIWLDKNRLVFENKAEGAKEVVARAGRILGDYLVCNGLDEMKCNRAKPNTVKWCPPTRGYVKINVDAAVNNDMEFIGIGVVARNEDGTVLAAAARRMFGRFSPHLGECMAVREGVWLAQSRGFSK
ncbi:hypothetical protein TIFTF001_053750 [Ficus carica]|uniref:RNase H type-1 domain-containing protein n=1 Tax=Ficus carica TaxID=3494 RepID=A0AA88EF93_FICCA|nr:hypothetical protein TIFTF001_053750 [Ficus carica]